MTSPGTAVRDEYRIEDVRQQDGTYPRKKRRYVIEVWLNLRFAPALNNPPRRYSEATLKRYVDGPYTKWLNGYIPSRPEIVADIQAIFPGVSKHQIEAIKSGNKLLRGKPGPRARNGPSRPPGLPPRPFE